MADDVRVEVHGYAELAAGIAILASHIEDAAGKEFLGVADQAAAKTRGSLHRRTGRTAGSVEASEAHGGALVRMGDGVPYAQFEEYGGRGWPHSPTGNFLYPAAMTMEPLLVAAAERTADREIGQMHWPSP
jgi:hypothetical protein